MADDYLAATRNEQRAWALAGENAPDGTARRSRLTWIARRSIYVVLTSHNDDKASWDAAKLLGRLDHGRHRCPAGLRHRSAKIPDAAATLTTAIHRVVGKCV